MGVLALLLSLLALPAGAETLRLAMEPDGRHRLSAMNADVYPVALCFDDLTDQRILGCRLGIDPGKVATMYARFDLPVSEHEIVARACFVEVGEDGQTRASCSESEDTAVPSIIVREPVPPVVCQ